MSIDVDVNVNDGIATITINRPERMNAMDAEHYKGLSQAWMRVRDDVAIRVAIITGAGEKAFSAGADLSSFEVDVPRRWPSTEKAREILGWQAEIAVREGIAQTVDWYKGARAAAQRLKA